MYEIIKEVIASKDYELYDMLKKIDTVWIQGGITDEQKAELKALAQESADSGNSYAPMQEQIEKMAADIAGLKERTDKLEGTEPTEPEEYPAWYKWDGTPPNPWNKGSKCTHKEKRWISKVDNNIWEPGVEGVHENIWKSEKEK